MGDIQQVLDLSICEWKFVEWYGLDNNLLESEDYIINTQGQVYSFKSNRFLKQSLTRGYYCYGLKFNKKNYNCSVHRLIAINYIPNPNKNINDKVDHINEIKIDNHISNLRWVSHSINIVRSRKGRQDLSLKELNNRKGVSNIDLRNVDIIQCECGASISRKDLYKNHLKSKKHINFINNIVFQTNPQTSISTLCICNGRISSSNKTRHLKSIKHQQYLQNQVF